MRLSLTTPMAAERFHSPRSGRRASNPSRADRSAVLRGEVSRRWAPAGGESVAVARRRAGWTSAAHTSPPPRSSLQSSGRSSRGAPSITSLTRSRRFGQRLDPSALRRRYKRACTAAGLRPVTLHGLRHAAGSVLARTLSLVTVRDVLGHAKLSTTNRYLHSKIDTAAIAAVNAAYEASANAPDPQQWRTATPLSA